jgi:hypothetical protein
MVLCPVSGGMAGGVRCSMKTVGVLRPLSPGMLCAFPSLKRWKRRGCGCMCRGGGGCVCDAGASGTGAIAGCVAPKPSFPGARTVFCLLKTYCRLPSRPLTSFWTSVIARLVPSSAQARSREYLRSSSTGSSVALRLMWMVVGGPGMVRNGFGIRERSGYAWCFLQWHAGHFYNYDVRQSLATKFKYCPSRAPSCSSTWSHLQFFPYE